jgi:hypothetical protein
MQPQGNIPTFEIDLGNTSDSNSPRVKLLNWNTVNYADIYADQTGEKSKITRITLHYNNGTQQELQGHIACENFLSQFQSQMGQSFQTFLSTAIPTVSSAGSGGLRSRT